MASRKLNVTGEAYDALQALRGPDESFSDVILRLADARSLRALAGVLTPAQADRVEQAIRASRKRSRARSERQAREGF